MRQPHDRQIRPFARLTSRRFGRLTSRRFFNIAPDTPLHDGRRLGVSHSPLHDGRGRGWFFIIAQPVIVFVTVFVLSSCTDGRYDALLRQADSLLTAKPDSAWTLLSAVDSADIARQSRSTQMRYQLLRAEAQNKAYVPFTTDSVLRRVVRYYDRHGSTNQQLKARYLLGCAYRDMHEAPLAIITWEEAVERADTLSHDCDYSTLYRVYGQMAEIYFRQYMPEKELYADQKQSDYALMAGDTINHIRALLQRNDAYLTLGDTASIFKNTEYVRQLYLEHGLTQEAAQVYPSAIHIAFDRGEYEKADSMMQIFENESGLFDQSGNIESGREKYHYFKGLYYMETGNSDSAEDQFRKLLLHDDVMIDGYRGLLSLFKKKHNADSIFKYARAYEDALAHYLEETHTEAIALSEAMFNYSRQQHSADVLRVKTQKLRDAFFIGIIISMLIFSILFFYYKREKQRKEEKEKHLIRLTEDYHQAIEHLKETRIEANLLKKTLDVEEKKLKHTSDTLTLIKEKKEEQVRHWEATIEDLKKEIHWIQASSPRMEANESEILARFHEIAKAHVREEHGRKVNVPARTAKKSEWLQLTQMTQFCHPSFFIFVKGHKLSELKMRVCLLSRFGFKNPEIATLTGANVKSISNARMQLANIFGLDATSLLDDYLSKI